MKANNLKWAILITLVAITYLAFHAWERNTLEGFRVQLRTNGYSPDQVKLKFKEIIIKNFEYNSIIINFEVIDKSSGDWTRFVVEKPVAFWNPSTIERWFVNWGFFSYK